MVEPERVREAVGWAVGELRARGLSLLSAPETVRTMPWSAVTRLDTEGGAFFLKTSARGFTREAEVIRVLAGLGVRHMTEVAAASSRLGAFLMPDAGVPFRTVIGTAADEGIIRRTLEAYADLQIAASGVTDRLFSIGVPDRRLSRLPRLLAELVESGILRDFDRAAEDDVAELKDSFRIVAELCERLEDLGLPETLEHSDFHDNNVLVKGGEVTISDHEAVSVSHPFFSLASFAYSLRLRLPPELFTPRNRAARDAYLGRWAEHAGRPVLEEAADIADALSPIVYALGFQNLVERLPADEVDSYRGNMMTALRSVGQLAATVPASACAR